MDDNQALIIVDKSWNYYDGSYNSYYCGNCEEKLIDSRDIDFKDDMPKICPNCGKTLVWWQPQLTVCVKWEWRQSYERCNG